MARALKVYGGALHLGGQRTLRAIMATTSYRAFAKATGISWRYAAITGNKTEIEAALARPSEVLVCPHGRYPKEVSAFVPLAEYEK